jgi:hypothetical protein
MSVKPCGREGLRVVGTDGFGGTSWEVRVVNRIQWEIRVPIFRNRFILQGLTMSLALPLGILIALLIFTYGEDKRPNDLNDALALIAMFFVLTALLVLALYGGRYAPGFLVDGDGVFNYTRAKHPRKSKLLNTLLILLGLFRGNLSAADTGLIAQSRLVMNIPWKHVTRVRYYPKHQTILVQGAFSEKMALFCTKANYTQVERMVREYSAGT